MKRNISLLAILTAALITPSLSLAHDRDHDDSRFLLRAFSAGSAYSPNSYAYNRRGTSYRYSPHPRARYLNHKGDRINHNPDRKAYRSDRYSNHHVQSYRHHQERSDHKYNSGDDRGFRRDDHKGRGKGKHDHRKESDHHKNHKHHS
ncbi:MAG: hypothetical protein V7699_08480 [Porticoccus sp.]